MVRLLGRNDIPSESKLIVVTATAYQSKPDPNFGNTWHESSQIYKIEKSPNRPNLVFNLTYLDKDIPYENLFSRLIKDVKKHGVITNRTLIYCQTRKQCSVVSTISNLFGGQHVLW